MHIVRRFAEFEAHPDRCWNHLPDRGRIYPENRIVVHYDKAEIVMLAAYGEDGAEINFKTLSDLCDQLGWRIARRHTFSSLVDLTEHARTLPVTEKGFVIRYSNGLRLKLKGGEYRRIHALISHCTPLATWEAVQAGDDLEAIRRDLPEESWGDFDAIVAALTARVDEIRAKVIATAERFADATDKDVGLQLRTLDPDVQPLIFSYRKGGGKLEDKAMAALYRMIRPTNNSLPATRHPTRCIVWPKSYLNAPLTEPGQKDLDRRFCSTLSALPSSERNGDGAEPSPRARPP